MGKGGEGSPAAAGLRGRIWGVRRMGLQAENGQAAPKAQNSGPDGKASEEENVDPFGTRAGQSPEMKANLLSFLLWSWVGRLIQLGSQNSLQAEDLYELNPRESTQWSVDKWTAAWAKEEALKRPTGPSVWSALFRCYWPEFWLAAIWRPVWLLAVVLQVYVLKALVRLADGKMRFHWWWGALLVGGMLLTSVVQSMAQHHCFTRMQKLGMKVRAVVCYAVFHKALAMRTAALGASTQGHMLNLITNDTQKLLDGCTYFHFVWSSVIEMVVIGVLVYVEVGVSALGGILVVFLTLPLQVWMARRVGHVRRPAVKCTDARVRLVGEILSGVRVVKYNGWVAAFLRRITGLRTVELSWIRKAAYIRSANSALKDTVTPLASLLTFGIYVATHSGNLDASKAFAVLAFFSILVRVFFIAPLGLQYFTESLVAVQRMQSFLHLSNGAGFCPPALAAKARAAHPSAAAAAVGTAFDWHLRDAPSRLSSSDMVPTQPTKPLGIARTRTAGQKAANGGEARAHGAGPLSDTRKEGGEEKASAWAASDEGEQFSLRDLSLALGQGEMVAVTGVVGSGKSSLLLALLGEMESVGGGFFVEGTVAYAPQQAWIFNDTVRNNILFGQPCDAARYAAVCTACALDPDIARLPAGHHTEIGERGVNLSGGQRARISLARAAYSQAPVAFLDDPLAAVDVPTAKHLLDQALGGAFKGRAVLLVTHNKRSLSYCDRVVVMDQGRLTEAGSEVELAQLGGIAEGGDESMATELGRTVETAAGEGEGEGEGEAEAIRAEGKSEGERAGEQEGGAQATAGGRAGQDEARGAEQGGSPAAESRRGGKLTVKEDRVEGEVTVRTYVAYIMGGGGWLTLALLVAFFMLSQAVRTLVDYWLGVWVDGKYEMQAGLYVAVYAVLAVGAGALSLGRALLFTWMALHAAQSMHADMALHVLRSPQLFFDQNPVGRILNRFSKDQSLVDELLPSTAQVTLELLMGSLGAIVIIAVLLPWILLCVPPLLLVFVYLQRRYTRVSRELKRLDGLSRSPMYAHFAQSLQGLASVRAYGAGDRLLHEFVGMVDANHRAYILFVHAGRWLGVRLDLCASVCVTGTALCVVLLRDSLAAGLAGVALVQSLQLSGFLQYGMRQAAETENLFTSVERIQTYAELPMEADADSAPGVISEDWPQHGEVAVEDLRLAYREDLAPVLDGVTFKVEAREKIGILGRTGAGKSSLAAALFRMVENSACGGRIVIDGVDIATVGLDDLRQRLSIIPQDPVLFKGTVRQNLDPFEVYTDAEIQEVLERVHLDQKLATLEGGLDSAVTENGDNFSVGQRQLLCLARALLRRSRIIVMDEATAAVDGATDDVIQATMRAVFTGCTVLTIAHRIDTVIDCDRVLVLQGGRVVEYDSPATLLSRGAGESVFAYMVEQAGPQVCAKLRQRAKEAEAVRADRRPRTSS